MALKDWSKRGTKGSDDVFYEVVDEGAVAHHYIEIIKIEATDSPYFGLWMINYHTEHKNGKYYVDSRQKAIKFAMDYMKKNDN